MKYSSFNLNEQNQKIESRIVVALERISEAFRVLLWNESKEKGQRHFKGSDVFLLKK